MRYSIGLVALAALVAAEDPASDVHDLTTDSFSGFMKEHSLVLAEFFAPWCGHCKALAPEYEAAATTLKERDIALAKIDCTEHEELCQEQGVEGYPTLKIFRGLEQVSPYSGPRKADAIVSFMTKQNMPAVTVLESETAHDEFKTSDKVVVVGYFAQNDLTNNVTFAEAAEAMRDGYLFGATADEALAKAAGISRPAIVLYKTFDEGKVTWEKSFTKDAIIEFVQEAATPLVGEVGPDTYAGYMAAGIPLAYIFSETAEERESLAKELKPLAIEHKGKINFATLDAAAFGQHGNNLNLQAAQWPAFAIQDTEKGLKFPYPVQGDAKDLTQAAIGTFVSEYLAGKVEPSVRSEPIPEKNDGPVKVVVAHNYQDIVMDDSKDVLVEFYAPWCGHCKALAPKYEELGALYQDYADKVVVAKVDATANDVPDEIQGFPTIRLFPKGAKEQPVDYSGDRTVKDLADFIRDSGSFQVDAWAETPESADTEGMPEQAAAATGKLKEKMAEAAEMVRDTLLDDDDDELHDEL